MDRLAALEAFVAIADAGSLAGAARRLRSSAPSVSRTLAGLEEALGARLVTRTTRSLSLTETGLAYLATARRVLMDLAEADAAAAGTRAAPVGRLRLTAPLTFGRMHLAPVARAFLEAAPGVSVEMMLADRVVDLVEEGFELALRIGALADSSLLARRVGQVRRMLLASPAYLAAHGTPETPLALADHRFVAFGAVAMDDGWSGARVTPRLHVNDAPVAIEAVLAGEGLTVAYSYVVAEALASGRLVEVLGAHAPASVPVQLVWPAGRHAAARLRAFVDFAAPRLAARIG
jgi:DNA-binding transcriptional LysR family regulator